MMQDLVAIFLTSVKIPGDRSGVVRRLLCHSLVQKWPFHHLKFVCWWRENWRTGWCAFLAISTSLLPGRLPRSTLRVSIECLEKLESIQLWVLQKKQGLLLHAIRHNHPQSGHEVVPCFVY